MAGGGSLIWVADFENHVSCKALGETCMVRG